MKTLNILPMALSAKLYDAVSGRSALLHGASPQDRETKKDANPILIACLGWGSLIWEPRSLPTNGHWFVDGPSLPVEFTRQSIDGRITLVVAENTDAIPVLWTKLDCGAVEESRRNLAKREGSPERLIGFWSLNSWSPRDECPVIGEWARSKGIDGVVWTALGPKFNNRAEKPSCEQVIDYLNQLEGDDLQRAEEYVRRTPTQIRTAYRLVIESQFGWTATAPQ